MTSRELEIFMTVAECKKMIDAARLLYITQSSVSQAIASIEKEYNVLLFERLSNSLFLTPSGEKLMSYARNYFAAKKDMEDYLKFSAHNHRLKVGATVTVGTCVLSPILSMVKKAIPGIDVTVHVANTHILEQMLLKNQIDVGLIEGIITDPDIQSKDVISDELVLICSPNHEFYGRDKVYAEELIGEDMILREKGSGTRALFENQMLSRRLQINVCWSCYNSEAIRNAVHDGHGISVISKRLVDIDAKNKRLWCCGIDGLDLSRSFSIVYLKDKILSDEILAFIKACETFAQEEKGLEKA